MITGFFLQSFYGIIVFLLSILPTVALPAGFVSAIALVAYYVNEFTWLFPVSSLLTVLGLALTFHLVLLTFDFTLWIIHLLRGR